METLDPVKVVSMNWSVREEFNNSSYLKRYELFCERLVEEKLYNNACLITLGEDGNVNLKKKNRNEEKQRKVSLFSIETIVLFIPFLSSREIPFELSFAYE